MSWTTQTSPCTPKPALSLFSPPSLVAERLQLADDGLRAGWIPAHKSVRSAEQDLAHQLDFQASFPVFFRPNPLDLHEMVFIVISL